MANMTRILQKIFGTSGGASEFGKIGSDAAGAPTTTKDLALIQSLSQFEGGLFDITADAAEPPRIEDINSLYLLMTSQLKYLFQKGIPEWIATEDYYANVSFVTDGAGGVYRCIQNALNKAPLTEPTYWQLISDVLDSANIKTAIEYGKPLGEVFAKFDKLAPAAFAIATPDTYFPELCLTDFDTYKDVAVANWPVLIDYLRGVKTIFNDGIAGEISSPGVTDWAISSNVASLTFTNNASHIALLAALLEDEVQHGSYTGWRTVTLATAIGNITAGTYAITNVNPTTRKITFAFTGGDASGSGSFNVDFYAYRIAGSTTTARVFSAKGLSIIGVNDANGYFVAGGLRRRGFMQGHYHDVFETSSDTGCIYQASGRATGTASWSPSDKDGLPDTRVKARTIETDGTNGTPRVAKETNSPAISTHIYLHGRRYVA